MSGHEMVPRADLLKPRRWAALTNFSRARSALL
jgi:hypothetical protein